MKISNRIIFFLLLITVIYTQSSDVWVELTNGNIITGQLLSADSAKVVLKTEFGELTFQRRQIVSMKTQTQPGEQPVAAIATKRELDQEARWRTIYSSMLLGNSIYGIGVPYVLGINDSQLATGLRLLMFGGGFYAALRYTKQMDLPMGRWQLQMAGAELGGLSIFPLISIVGYKNWQSFDPNGKIAWTYTMVAMPLGIWQADRLYSRWQLSNGQASLVSKGIILGLANTFGLINLVHSDNWRMSQGLVRAYTVLAYSGAVAGGYLTKKAVAGKSYTEDDAYFLGGSATVGLLNGMFLNNLLDIRDRKLYGLMLMAGINGFSYWADKMNRDIDLKRGQGQIIMLGAGASYLTWLGIAVITNFNLLSDGARLMDMASITLGWYGSYQWMRKQNLTASGNSYKQHRFFSLAPSVILDGKRLRPAVNVSLRF